MTVYSFACSTPDDWSSLYFWLKTFGPGLIAGSIAFLAYQVANTQKTIATNKYNLDMFDKRWSVFETYHDMFNTISSAKRKATVDYITLKKEKTNFDKCIMKIYKVYDKVKDYDLINSYDSLLLNIKNHDNEISTLKKENLFLISEVYYHLQPEEFDDIEELKEIDKKITEIQNKKIGEFDIFMENMVKLLDEMELQLKVPHNPY